MKEPFASIPVVVVVVSAQTSIAQELPTYDDHNVAARDSNEVADTLNRRCYPYTRNGGQSWSLGSSLFLSVRIPIQDEAIDVGRSAP